MVIKDVMYKKETTSIREKFLKIKPVYLYLLSGVFFICSKMAAEGSVLNYTLTILGIGILITAFVKYFRS